MSRAKQKGSTRHRINGFSVLNRKDQMTPIAPKDVNDGFVPRLDSVDSSDPPGIILKDRSDTLGNAQPALKAKGFLHG